MMPKIGIDFYMGILGQITGLAPDKGVGVRVGMARDPLDAAPKKRPHRSHDTVEV
ncbi:MULTISPECIES: hypothetical protein [unclassified Mesorhizobium]|uniref:hypothetical protein n=1 Tax=unclassified Mesorhizobium TaxID=325217 RepID=UPI0013E3FEB4|nr:MULTISPECIES: hypothetical protein [unclassified Mesorhizobium]